MTTNEISELYMRRCLELASSAEGLTYPNPLVGAVLVHEGKIIAEGKHAFYGAPHAEPDAISKINDAEILKQCTLYVNLEPCCHFGKTPPCTDRIIATGIPHVVVAALDTSSKIDGKGIKALNEAGIVTTLGVLENEARELNRFFYTYHEKKRPYILLKWAQTPDGFIDSDRKTPETPPVRISNSLTQIFDHHLRNRYQAIMVGTNTIVMDNPNLTNRCWYGKNPLRITVDRHGVLNHKYNIFNDDAESIVFTENRTINYGNRAETIPCTNLMQIMKVLHDRRIQSLIVEGGAKLLNSFIELGLWDEIITFTGDFPLGKGVKAPVVPAGKFALSTESLGTNTVERIVNLKSIFL
ncbi:MAG: bifunctional diaminohydroxyphosphoribosylaminopyrimidine deaminase/5-amino-6-(5-phosphoribosylamino)uracil reductase RibD [Prevotellaceae bacterium]|jgi:diaminohydroxyphosphoribosylaminopyrimidine deaminase/5-amino-6-(5-phosphoribosylamino)uracil reductase|nr:bifunctional diaminohydroxyphosphoribosylaminopyrimidine deaminase/5-amino-6-(5-phosphoribosylamino)uracil reductase RibD [Prevotellaceae bacterium]